jgi:hypothetical protein
MTPRLTRGRLRPAFYFAVKISGSVLKIELQLKHPPVAERLDCGVPRLREPLLERTKTIRFPGVLTRTKAPLKRAQSRRFAHFPVVVSI